VHLFGDMITKNGVPILWPIPLGRRTWRMIGAPRVLAVKAGGTVEVLVLRTAFALVSLLAMLGLLAPAVLRRFDLDT
ncbi:MAG TPA: metal-dependent hydrolase, partial [Actinoplanes sp.]|nr:metal-dependent hydrolase [Actinoplanes sp.]